MPYLNNYQVVEKFSCRCSDCGRSFEFHDINDVNAYAILAMRHSNIHNHESVVESTSMYIKNNNVISQSTPEIVAIFPSI